MSEPSELSDLVAYLVRTTRLTRADAARLVDEVLSYLDERPEEFVSRRHRVLQAEGAANSEIYSRLRPSYLGCGFVHLNTLNGKSGGSSTAED
jgi:hypothetical protein